MNASSKHGPRSGRILRRSIGLLLAVGVASSFFACQGLSKAEVRERLAALEKNADAAPFLRTKTFDFDLGEGLEPVEAPYLFVPAAEPSDEPPLVLIHGTPSSLYTWVDLLFESDLEVDRDIYALDVLGHGGAPVHRGTHSFQLCADFIAAFLRALSLEDVCLVGNSYGGEFVWRAALDHPDLIAKMVLMSSSGYERPEDGFLPEEVKMREYPKWITHRAYLLNSKSRVGGALQPHFREPVSDERTTEIYLVCDNAGNWRAMVELACDENGERMGELTEVVQPTLLVWGERDLAYPVQEYAERFHADIPNSTLVVVPDSGHYPQEERPRALARALEAFFKEEAR